MVRMPLPAPCRIAKAGANAGPAISSIATPTGWASAARRADSSGCTPRRKLNSSKRPATWAGPISAPTPTAAARLAPVASSIRGRCVAIAVLMNQVAANTKASRVVVRPGNSGFGGEGASAGRVSWMTGFFNGKAAGALGSQALSGSPISRCRAAQPKQAPRQPNSVSIQADMGQPTVLAKPAINVIPVMAPRASRPYRRTRLEKAAS
ncbi:hypothetical protein D3C71_1155580 [compost metagenome]